VLLYPGLAASARNLGTGLGVVGALPPIALIYDHGLMNQRGIHRHIENGIAEIDAVNGIARLISDCDFHSVAACLLKPPF
jgi:hypothetical protein